MAKNRDGKPAAHLAPAAKQKTKPKKDWTDNFFMNSKKPGELVLKCILLLVIPYAFLLLWGLVFDGWLKLYGLRGFIFYFVIVLYVAALALIAIAIVKFVRTRGKK